MSYLPSIYRPYPMSKKALLKRCRALMILMCFVVGLKLLSSCEQHKPQKTRREAKRIADSIAASGPDSLNLINQGYTYQPQKTGSFPACYALPIKSSEGWHSLEIKVMGEDDMAVKLIDTRTQEVVRFAYIIHGKKFEMTEIPGGTYYLRIMSGKHWYAKMKGKRCEGVFGENLRYRSSQKCTFRNHIDKNHQPDWYSLFIVLGGSIGKGERFNTDFIDKEQY